MFIYQIKVYTQVSGVVDELFQFRSGANKKKQKLEKSGLFVTPVIKIKLNESK